VAALPRGGVPVGFEIAQQLHLPLDVFMVRKIGVPSQPELALGAVASGGIRVLNERIAAEVRLSGEQTEQLVSREVAELARREREYRGEHAAIVAAGKVVVLVDDGLATGASMRAAIAALQSASPARVVIAAPVAAAESLRQLASIADEVVCPLIPNNFYAVGEWYEDFRQVTDSEVSEYLKRARERSF